MYSLKLLSQFLHDMRAQKLRTFLTLFGIVWGTVAVVLLLAFGVGLKAFSLKAMHGMGKGIVILWPSRTKALNKIIFIFSLHKETRKPGENPRQHSPLLASWLPSRTRCGEIL